ncbi:hypothetical protein LSH36_1737g00002 [Paralvinella palmiformis]|uniref:Uncharacterized protein n=1 Tax=Paralvinella palmiformis TaxID=53620 RepID=A0AAD9MQS3_9ANNE|nr:hypothetical protein LSH36_1737g00002 [Paralvinella palmiformis]
MAKVILLFTPMAVMLASSDALRCYNGTNIGSHLQANIADGCGGCLSLNIGVYVYGCSPVDCSQSTFYTNLGFKCCMDKDLCNSAAGVGHWFLMNAMLVLVAYLLSRN